MGKMRNHINAFTHLHIHACTHQRPASGEQSVANANKTGDRRQKLALSPVEGTEDRMGKPGNQDNRV